VLEAVRSVLMSEPRVGYALVFGSCARGTAHARSDLDVAIGTDAPLDVHQLGDLVVRIESASGRNVDLVLLDEAPPALAYRVFRDGVVVVERDRPALVRRKARAILDYLDFKPIEDLCVRGVLAAARHGRWDTARARDRRHP
jgi:predicted nucleotidyltransferase